MLLTYIIGFVLTVFILGIISAQRGTLKTANQKIMLSLIGLFWLPIGIVLLAIVIGGVVCDIAWLSRKKASTK